jgi:uncharacterized protein YciI
MTESATPQSPVPWSGFVKEAKEKGLPANELFAVISTPTTGVGPVFANLDPHLAYQAKLEADGVMFAAGPLSATDGSAWAGMGIFFYRADSLADAIALAEQDPMHKSGARTFEVRTWLLNEGTFSVRFSYSTSKFNLG